MYISSVPNNKGIMEEAIKKLEKLGKLGLVISIAYGPCGNKGILYSVDVMSPDGETFDKPFAVNTFQESIDVAELESIERGWIPS